MTVCGCGECGAAGFSVVLIRLRVALALCGLLMLTQQASKQPGPQCSACEMCSACGTQAV